MRKTTSSNFINEQRILANCPITSFFHWLGGRWRLAILWNLRDGEQRFSDLKDRVTNISDKMLSQQLKQLQESGFVQRTVIPETPVRVMYGLTPQGEGLLPVLQHIHDWSVENQLVVLPLLTD
jgi:DNA-binding HxlR family transcriptional regulator